MTFSKSYIKIKNDINGNEKKIGPNFSKIPREFPKEFFGSVYDMVFLTYAKLEKY